MDDLGWRDCVGTSGKRLRSSSSQELFARVVGAPRQEANGDVVVCMRMNGAAHWLWDMLDDCYPGWQEVEACGETVTVRLKAVVGQGFMAEHIANATRHPTAGMTLN